MALPPGTRFGPYEVAVQIGVGGMGEVYRARDTKLDRDVAIKVLPASLAGDPDRIARFQREAKTLAALNHPNIAAIYGLEEGDRTKALVMELVEGPTLADRIAQGAVPVDEALPIATQIAEALEAAHEQGIIHRDLKPANIKLRPDGVVKVLDFGLAKALEPAGAMSPGLSQSPTITTPAMTQAGMVLGTAAYMSPEQARGKTVDKRADIWAFGCVLFEMFTGRSVFSGEDVTDTIISVASKEPDWAALPSLAPAVSFVLRRCLEKDPKKRLRDVGEARLALEGAFETSVSPTAETAVAVQPALGRALPWVAGSALVGGLVIGLTVSDVMRPNSPPSLARLAINTAVAPLRVGPVSSDLALSPDGQRVAYLALGEGGQQIVLRAMDQLTVTPLVVGGNPWSPFFSPDGEWVGYYDTDGPVLRKVSIHGGTAVEIARLAANMAGASWGADDTIVFGTQAAGGGLWRVAAGGGEPEPLTTPDPERDELFHWWPQHLPGGRAVLFTIVPRGGIGGAQLAVLSLEDGTQTILGRGGSYPRYASSGHIVYGVSGTLRAVGFDFGRLEVTSDPFPVMDGVVTKGSGAADFDIAPQGSLVYVSGIAGGGNSVVWVDQQGREEPLGLPQGTYGDVRVSPDGTSVALHLLSTETGGTDVWTYDIMRGTLSRLTTDPAEDQYPLWTLDGQRIVWASNREGTWGLFWRAADGTGEVERLITREGASYLAPHGWSPDGTTLVFNELDAGRGTDGDIGVLSMDGERPAELLIQTEFGEGMPVISPDGGWIAYQANPSGRFEIYVERFPDLGNRRQVSTDGGVTPLWSSDGQRLFYRGITGRQVFAVPVGTQPTFTVGNSEPLFEGPYANVAGWRTYDVAPDGERFAIVRQGVSATDGEAPNELIVVLNWPEELKRLVPAN